MSKLSFRARALDPSKPMPIYLAEELPDLPEYSAINRAVPQMPSGMEKEEESVSKSPSKVTAHFALIRAATEKNEVSCAAILPKADKSRMALDRPIGVEIFGFYGEFGIEPSVRMKVRRVDLAGGPNGLGNHLKFALFTSPGASSCCWRAKNARLRECFFLIRCLTANRMHAPSARGRCVFIYQYWKNSSSGSDRNSA